MFMYQWIVLEGRSCWRFNLFYYCLYFSKIGYGPCHTVVSAENSLGGMSAASGKGVWGPASHSRWPPVADRLSWERGEFI